jgi:hypothetical protein
MSNLFGPPFHADQLGGRLHLENLIALRERNPGLFATGPDMPCRSQPRGSVPARTRTTLSLGMPQTHEPHSGHINRVLTRPLAAVRWSGRGSIPLI